MAEKDGRFLAHKFEGNFTMQERDVKVIVGIILEALRALQGAKALSLFLMHSVVSYIRGSLLCQFGRKFRVSHSQALEGPAIGSDVQLGSCKSAEKGIITQQKGWFAITEQKENVALVWFWC